MQVIKKALELKQLRNAFKTVGVAGTLAFISANAHAEGMADLAAGIDKVDILAGFTAVALLLAAVLAARMGIRKVLGMIK